MKSINPGTVSGNGLLNRWEVDLGLNVQLLQSLVEFPLALAA